MRVDYKLERDDYLNFSMFQMKKFPRFKRSLLIQRLVMPIMLLALMYTIYKSGDYSIFGIVIMYLVGAGLWFFLYPNYIKRSIRRRLDAILNSNPDLIGKKAIILKDDGIYEVKIEEDKEEEKLGSKEIIEFDQTKDTYYIYINSEAAYILPKKFVEDQEEFERKIGRLLRKGE